MKKQRIPIIFLFTFTCCCAVLPACMNREVQSQDKPIAVQLYTLRNIASFEERLKAVHAAGISAVETAGRHDLTSDALNALLEKYKLRAVAMHIGIGELRSDLSGVVAFNKEIGNQVLVVPSLPEVPKDPQSWAQWGNVLGELAEQVESEGLTLAYHNHAYEMVDLGGKTGLELMFETAGTALKAEIDVAWVARGGRDPVEMINKLSDRLFSIHAKDNAPEGEAIDEGGFASVGKGVLDWAEILPAAKRAGAQWYIIEHDHPLDPAASIKVSADFLRAKL